MTSTLIQEMTELLSRHNLSAPPPPPPPPQKAPRKKRVTTGPESVPQTQVSQYYSQPAHQYENPNNHRVQFSQPNGPTGLAPVPEAQKVKRQLSQKQLDALKAGREARMLNRRVQQL